MKNLYLFLAFLGLIIPYYFFLSFLIDYGLNLQQFIDFLFANPISTFFVMDLIIATIVFYVFLCRDSRDFKIGNWWLYIIFSLVVGLSFAFPMYLYRREKELR